VAVKTFDTLANDEGTAIMAIFETLKDEHDLLRNQLAKILDLPDGAQGKREEYLEQLKKTLHSHTLAEEEIVYETLLPIEHLESEVREGIEEHRLSNQLLVELNTLDVTQAQWEAKVKALKDLLTHHLKEEEEELFAEGRKAFDSSRQEELNERYLQKKEEVLKEVSLTKETPMEAELQKD
jgi:hemerythrin superfamily protein